MVQAHVGMFTTVDQAEDPSLFIGLVDRIQESPDVQAARAEALEALALQPGHLILDLGCGTGDHSAEIARVTSECDVVGVDFSRAMIEEAGRRHAASGLRLAFEPGDAQALRFGTGSFDACRAERLLSHVPDYQRALSEMVRVVRPGGRVAVIDGDAAGVLIDHDDRDITSTLVAAMASAIQNPWIGRQLRRLFLEHGLVEVEVRPKVLEIGHSVISPILRQLGGVLIRSGAIPAGAFAAWLEALEQADDAGRFYLGMTVFVATGRKP